MLPDRISNPGPLTYESGALPQSHVQTFRIYNRIVVFRNDELLLDLIFEKWGFYVDHSKAVVLLYS